MYHPEIYAIHLAVAAGCGGGCLSLAVAGSFPKDSTVKYNGAKNLVLGKTAKILTLPFSLL